MKHYVGIDLGTTNSAICSYDGENLKHYKSPEQYAVTPSAIYFGRRSWYYGVRAYNNEPREPENTATRFKRFMGTSTPIKIPALNLTLTPEECSAEILKVLFGYLPEEIRNDPETGTVITVPAAFNQMQRDSTLDAAKMADIGKVALMQEPVAAVMSVMRARKFDGTFLIYDLGGGTFDIALAQSIAERVSLLDHGGINMCGGRDFDRLLVDNIVIPWLLDHFDLPDNFTIDPQFKSLRRLAEWASEQAKIDLSRKEEAVINIDEASVRVKDRSGKEIYLEIPVDRQTLDGLIQPRIVETIESIREVLTRAHLTAHDVDRIVFIGGPTQYKMLRDYVSFQLGLPADTQVDPMTAVAEGAALFAESIDWSSATRPRKSIRGSISTAGKFNLAFEFIARTLDSKSRIVAKTDDSNVSGMHFQVESRDTGWSSGRLELKNGVTIDIVLSKYGDNTFQVFVFDSSGGPVAIDQDIIIITRTAAMVDAIPASNSIGIEIRESMKSAATRLKYLVRKGESLPKKGTELLQAAEALRAGGPGALVFNLFEGEIENPVRDNQPVGTLKITGEDFDTGVISPGDKLDCEFEVSDSGRVSLSVSVSNVGAMKSGEFYSRTGGHDFESADARQFVMNESRVMMDRVDKFAEKLAQDHPKLDAARNKLLDADDLAQREDPEDCKQGMENVFEAKRMLAQVRKENLKTIRQTELEAVTDFFQTQLRQYARPSEVTAFQNLTRTAQRDKDNINSGKFEDDLDKLRGMNFGILWRQDSFVIDVFQGFSKEEFRFTDKAMFHQLVMVGDEAVKSDDMENLRKVVASLYQIRIYYDTDQCFLDAPNIL